MQHSMRVRWFSRPIFARCVGAPGVGALPTRAVAGGFHAFFFRAVCFTCCVVCSAGLDTPAGDGAYAALHWLGLIFFFFGVRFWCTWMLS